MGYPALSDNEEENQAHSKDHGHEEPRVKDEMEGEDQGIDEEQDEDALIECDLNFHLDPTHEPGVYNLHSAILCTNKKIYSEAVAVLYGENIFTWSVLGDQSRRMWHYPSSSQTSVIRRNSRLIKRMFLLVQLQGCEEDPSFEHASYMIKKNLRYRCNKLSLCNFKILKVRFFNSFAAIRFGSMFGMGSARFRGKPSAGERCLESLKKLRAEKMMLNSRVSPAYTAELKAIIQGPKDDNYTAIQDPEERKVETDFEGCGPEDEDGEHDETYIGESDAEQSEYFDDDDNYEIELDFETG